MLLTKKYHLSLQSKALKEFLLHTTYKVMTKQMLQT